MIFDYMTIVTANNVLEGQLIGDWLVKTVDGKPCNVVELQGTVGASVAIDRKKGFADAIAKASNIKIIRSQSGDFTRSKGKEVMESALHDLFPFTAGEVTGLGADNFDIRRFGNRVGEAFLTIDGHAGPNGALQFNDVTRLTVDGFHQPVANQLAFQHVVGGHDGHVVEYQNYPLPVR